MDKIPLKQRIFNCVLAVLAVVCLFNLIWFHVVAGTKTTESHYVVRETNPMPGNNPGGSSTGPPPVSKSKDCD